MFDYYARWEAEQDELGATGDARRCPVHPNVKTSTDDGMFDICCGECEYMAEHGAELWERDPANPKRRYCGDEVGIGNTARNGSSCRDNPRGPWLTDDEIPF